MASEIFVNSTIRNKARVESLVLQLCLVCYSFNPEVVVIGNDTSTFVKQVSHCGDLMFALSN